MKISKFFKSERGASAVEAALIMPFLMVLYFGLQDLTTLITYNRKITATSSTISDTVAQWQATILKADITDIFNAVDLTMQPISSTNVHVDVYGYRMVSGVVTQRWKTNNGSTPVCNAPDTTNFTSMMSASNDLIVSVSCMNYTPWIVSFMGKNLLGQTTFLLNQQITSRPRSSTTLDCYTTSAKTTLCT